VKSPVCSVCAEFRGVADPVINYDINTAGQGFANNAVIATIGVEDDPAIECLDDLLDIKVANYPAAGAYESSHAKQFSHIHLFAHGALNSSVVLFPSSVS
jgi:hypothetical protein